MLETREPRNDTATAATTSNFTYRQETKLRKRTKTGCLTCRKRRIKCGEERPTCNNCIKSKRQCEGYSQRVIFKAPLGEWEKTHSTTTYTLPYHFSKSSSVGYPTESYPGDRPWENGTIRGTTRYSGLLAPANLASSWPAVAKTPSAVTQNPGLTTMYGYVSMRGSQQDATVPAAVSTYDHGILDEDVMALDDEHVAEIPHNKSASRDNREILQAFDNFSKSPLISDQGFLERYLPSLNTTVLTDRSVARVFAHFLQCLGPSLSIFEESSNAQELPGSPTSKLPGISSKSFWTNEVAQKALSSPMLSHAILAVSASHVANLQGASSIPSVRHYTYSLRYLHRAISKPYRVNQVETLATILLLAVFESLLNPEYNKWAAHLAAARNILSSVGVQNMMQRKNTARQNPAAGKCGGDFVASSIGESRTDENDDGNDLSDADAKSEAFDVGLVDLYVDMFWQFARQNVYHSLISGERTPLGSWQLTNFPPGAQFGQSDSIRGSHCVLITLLGRIADFGAEDRARKEACLQVNGGFWRFRDSNMFGPSSLPKAASGPFLQPLIKANHSNKAPRDYSDDRDAPAAVTLGTHAQYKTSLESWKQVFQPLSAFGERLHKNFPTMSVKEANLMCTPFGAPLYHPFYASANTWMIFYMAHIITLRIHPDMPPAATAAIDVAAPQTSWYAIQICRIAAGIIPTLERDPMDVGLMGALVESIVPLWMAGIQFTDNTQRAWVIDTLGMINRRTGFHLAQLASRACQTAWGKAGEMGRGPTWTIFHGQSSRERSTTPQPASSFTSPSQDKKLMRSRTSSPMHWAMGLLNTVKDIVRSPYGSNDFRIKLGEFPFDGDINDKNTSEDAAGKQTASQNEIEDRIANIDEDAILSRLKLPIDRVRAADLDIETLKRAENFHEGAGTRSCGASENAADSRDCKLQEAPPSKMKTESIGSDEDNIHYTRFRGLMEARSVTKVQEPTIKQEVPPEPLETFWPRTTSANKRTEEAESSVADISMTTSDIPRASDNEEPSSADEAYGTSFSNAHKLKLVDKVMAYFYSIFRATPRVHGNRDANSQVQNRGGGEGANSISETKGSMKRSRNNTNNKTGKTPEDNEGDDEGSRKRSKAELKRPQLDSDRRKFACPYFKRNPHRYQHWRSCVGPGWDLVRRMKEHLYRNHTLPIYCHRCYAKFGSDTLLKDHHRADEPCTKQAEELIEGFDKTQEKLLRCRKQKHPEPTEEEKWKETYRILFPDDEEDLIPSPYYDYQTDRSALQRSDSPSNELARYEEFLRRELPPAVRRELERAVEREFSPLEERLKCQLIEIVRDLQLQLFRSYTQSRNAAGTNLTPKAEAGQELKPETPADSAGSSSVLENQIAAFAPAPDDTFEFDPVLFQFSSFEDFQDSAYSSLLDDSLYGKDAWVEGGSGEYAYDDMDNGEGPSSRSGPFG